MSNYPRFKSPYIYKVCQPKCYFTLIHKTYYLCGRYYVNFKSINIDSKLTVLFTPLVC